MSIEDVEQMFEKKTKLFQDRMKQYQIDQLVPLTIQLIQKYALFSEEYAKKLQI